MLPWGFLLVNQFDSVSGSLDSIIAIGRVLGSLSRPIFMITARGTPSTAPINPQAHPQNATSINITIGDISSLSPANCGSTNAPQAC